MKPLSEVLPSIKPIAEPLIKSYDLSNMEVPGLTTKDGKMNTLSISNQQKNSVTTKEQNKCLVLRDDKEGQKKLSNLLLISFDVLDTFGKQVDQLKNINSAFQMFLEDYTYKQVEQAFKEYMKNNSVMPKPADIIKIIDKPFVPKIVLSDEQEKAREYLNQKYANLN